VVKQLVDFTPLLGRNSLIRKPFVELLFIWVLGRIGDDKIQSLPLRNSQFWGSSFTSWSLPDVGLVVGLSKLWPSGQI